MSILVARSLACFIAGLVIGFILASVCLEMTPLR